MFKREKEDGSIFNDFIFTNMKNTPFSFEAMKYLKIHIQISKILIIPLILFQYKFK